MATSRENDMLMIEPLMICMLYHSTLDGAQLNKQTMLQELQQQVDNIKIN
jgi:hypothetical protein